MPISGVAERRASMSTVPRKPVPPVTKTFLWAKKSATVLLVAVDDSVGEIAVNV